MLESKVMSAEGCQAIAAEFPQKSSLTTLYFGMHYYIIISKATCSQFQQQVHMEKKG
jgi:hypothetical protein